MQTFRSLRHRNYRLYFIGQTISLVGSLMQSTALQWLAYHLTNQSKWPAFLMIAMIGPTLLLGAWSGSLADRHRKRSLIVGTQLAFLCSATLLTVLSFAGLIHIWLLLVLMFCHGVIQAIDLPTRLAFVPDLVDRDDLINTVALNSVQFNVARAVGPAIAGVLLATLGYAFCFLINAISYVAVVIALLMMKDFRERSKPHHSAPRVSGLSVLRSEPRLLLLILLAGVVAVAGWPLQILLPAFSKEILHREADGYSIMLSAIGIGAIFAALTAATYGTVPRQSRLLKTGLCCVCIGLGCLSQMHELWSASICCGLFGYGMILFFATGQGIVQLGATDEHRGKIMGFWAMMLSGGAPVGNLFFGPAADQWGVAAMIMVQSILIAVALILVVVKGAAWIGTPSQNL